MAMTLLRARKRSDGSFFFRVLLDNTQSPQDRDWIRDYMWPPTPTGLTESAYVTQIKQETRLLSQQELQEIQNANASGTTLAGEGQVF